MYSLSADDAATVASQAGGYTSTLRRVLGDVPRPAIVVYPSTRDRSVSQLLQALSTPERVLTLNNRRARDMDGVMSSAAAGQVDFVCCTPTLFPYGYQMREFKSAVVVARNSTAQSMTKFLRDALDETAHITVVSQAGSKLVVPVR